MGKKPPTIILRPQPTLTLKPSLVVDEDRFSEGKPGPDPLKLPGQPVDEPRESKWARRKPVADYARRIRPTAMWAVRPPSRCSKRFPSRTGGIPVGTPFTAHSAAPSSFAEFAETLLIGHPHSRA